MMNGNDIAKKITRNEVFQAATVMLGFIFTVSALVNHYYMIKANKAILKEKSGKN